MYCNKLGSPISPFTSNLASKVILALKLSNTEFRTQLELPSIAFLFKDVTNVQNELVTRNLAL